ILSGGLPQLFRSYLLGFVFWNGVGVGSLAVLMLQYLIRGSWGFLVRRVLEAATRTLPLTAILFIPLIFGVKYIFPWADLAGRPAEFVDIVNRKLPYLTTGFWAGRGILYFAIWLILIYLLNRY